MILFGRVSSIEVDNTIFKIVFPDKENLVSPPLQKADHVGILEVGNSVVVAFPSNDVSTGVIIGKI